MAVATVKRVAPVVPVAREGAPEVAVVRVAQAAMDLEVKDRGSGCRSRCSRIPASTRCNHCSGRHRRTPRPSHNGTSRRSSLTSDDRDSPAHSWHIRQRRSTWARLWRCWSSEEGKRRRTVCAVALVMPLARRRRRGRSRAFRLAARGVGAATLSARGGILCVVAGFGPLGVIPTNSITTVSLLLHTSSDQWCPRFHSSGDVRGSD